MADASTLLATVGTIIASVLGGGFFGAWLTHKRLAPKSSAEAKSITAAAQDQDWSRFQREIDRLVKRCEAAEAKAEAALNRAHNCEEREGLLKARVMELEAYNLGQGKARQEAAEITARERLEQRTVGGS